MCQKNGVLVGILAAKGRSLNLLRYSTAQGSDRKISLGSGPEYLLKGVNLNEIDFVDFLKPVDQVSWTRSYR